MGMTSGSHGSSPGNLYPSLGDDDDPGNDQEDYTAF